MIIKYDNSATVKKIRIKLVENDKTEEDLNNYLNWTRQTWYRKVQGGSSISLDELQKISVFLDCDIGDLV